MEKARWTVKGMVEKFGGKEYVEADFPTTVDEIFRVKSISVISDTGQETEFDYSEKAKVSNQKRGFGLMFQSAGESLTEEEKLHRKAHRKADNSEISELRKLAKERNMSLADLIKTLR